MASLDIENELLHKHELLRPGFARVSLGYYWPDDEIDFLISAVEFIANEVRLLKTQCANSEIFYD
jgi:hypothetical protein